jgi:hypothetical protein
MRSIAVMKSSPGRHAVAILASAMPRIVLAGEGMKGERVSMATYSDEARKRLDRASGGELDRCERAKASRLNEAAEAALTDDELAWVAYETFVPHRENAFLSVEDMSRAMKTFWLRFAYERMAMGWKPKKSHDE